MLMGLIWIVISRGVDLSIRKMLFGIVKGGDHPQIEPMFSYKPTQPVESLNWMHDEPVPQAQRYINFSTACSSYLPS